MPLECSLEYVDAEGIEGSNTIDARLGTSVVIELEHAVSAPVDAQTGRRRGSRVHSPVVITKELDKATPLLYQAVCRAQVLPKLKINWYHVTDDGVMELYYWIELEQAIITRVETLLPNTRESSEEQKGHLERLHVQYRKIIWTWDDGGIMAEDDWRQSDA